MAEVLFAIIILGLGLILIAAAFPIGAAQSTKAQDATMAAMLGRLAYDQMTNVPAGDVTPDAGWGATILNTGATANLDPPINRYCKLSPTASGSYATPGKALVMGFLDGTQTLTSIMNTPQPRPDLRAKLVYPVPCYYETMTNPPPQPWTAAVSNPTWADDAPQDQDWFDQATGNGDYNRTVTFPGWPSMLGIAAYKYSPPGGSAFTPVSYASIWGFKEAPKGSGKWYENVQWVSQTDRRYYWYAFYRQMYEEDFIHPLVFSQMTPGHAPLLTWFQADLITRRTYRVLIMACKVPATFNIEFDNSTTGTPQMVRLALKQIEPPGFFQNSTGLGGPYRLGGYVRQWTQPNPQYPAAPILGPVRVPEKDSQIAGLAGADLAFDASHTWLSGNYVNNLVNAKIARTGGIVIDAWANIYQIVDVVTNQAGTSAIRLDKPLKSLATSPFAYGWSSAATGADIRDALPLWFNPQAISVFPTIMTKQAEKP